MRHRHQIAPTILALAALTGTAHGQATLEIVVQNGDAAPGAVGNFASVGGAAIDGSGVVYFQGDTFQQNEFTVDTGIWFGTPNSPIGILALEGQQVPGFPAGVTYRGFDNFSIDTSLCANENNTVAFSALINTDGSTFTDEFATLVGVPGALQRYLDDATPLPIVRVGTEEVASRVLFNDADELAFIAEYRESSTSRPDGIFGGALGALTQFAVKGERVPIPGSTDRLLDRLLEMYDFANDGTVTFGGQATQGTDCLWVRGPSGVQGVCRHGTPAPGTDGAEFDLRNLFGGPFLYASDENSIVFHTHLQGGDVIQETEEIIFSGSPASFAPLMRTGEQAIGFGPETIYLGVGTLDLRIYGYANGVAAIQAHVWEAPDPGSVRDVLYVGPPTNLQIVAQSGDPVPLHPGIAIGSILNAAINHSGDVLFNAILEGPGVINGMNDRAILGVGPDGILRTVIRSGTPFDIDPDPNVTENYVVDSINIPFRNATNEFYKQDFFNDNAQFVVNVSLTGFGGAVMRGRLESPSINVCASDFDNNGNVNIIDFGVFGAAFGSSIGDPTYNIVTDFNGDGLIDIIDFGFFGQQFGRTDCRQ